MNDTVVAIVGAFFIIGIAAGIIAVVAMSVLRAERRGRRATTPTLLTTTLTDRASRRKAPAGTTPCPAVTRAGRGNPTPTSAAGRAALGEGKLPRVSGRGRGAR